MFGEFAIDVNGQSLIRRLAAIEADGDMMPGARLERLVCDNFAGLVLPCVNDMDGGFSGLQPEIPAAIVFGMIHAGKDGPIGSPFDKNKCRVGEGICALEVGDIADVYDLRIGLQSLARRGIATLKCLGILVGLAIDCATHWAI